MTKIHEVTELKSGGTLITNPSPELMYLATAKQAVRAEARGMRLTRGPKITPLILKRFGLKRGTPTEEVLARIDQELATLGRQIDAFNAGGNEVRGVKVVAQLTGRVRLHIDHINNAGGQVWAVRVGGWKRGAYFVVHWMVIDVPCWTHYRKAAPPNEPRAWLEVTLGRVLIREKRGRLSAWIRDVERGS